jgi:futalosine hydrolase
MNKLIVVATSHELDWLIKAGTCNLIDSNRGFIKQGEFKIPFVVTGMGISNTLLNLPFFLKEYRPELIINTGIGGSTSEKLPIYKTYSVESDCYADMAIIRDNQTIFLHDDGTAASQAQVFFSDIDISKYLKDTEGVQGVTVSSFYNLPLSERPEIYRKNNNCIESMEGASVFQVANMLHVKVCALRTVSNFVWQKQSEWDTAKAVEINNKELVKLLNTL